MKYRNIALVAVLLMIMVGCVVPSYTYMTLEVDSIDLFENVQPTTNELIVIDDTLYIRAVVPPTGVAWVPSTALPGGGDNILLVGHNAKEAFGRLDEVELGDKITISINFTEHTYYVTQLRIIPSKGISKETRNRLGYLLGSTGNEQVTLFTCHGKGSTHRLLIIGEK